MAHGPPYCLSGKPTLSAATIPTKPTQSRHPDSSRLPPNSANPALRQSLTSRGLAVYPLPDPHIQTSGHPDDPPPHPAGMTA
jgi:hypothetical protein